MPNHAPARNLISAVLFFSCLTAASARGQEGKPASDADQQQILKIAEGVHKAIVSIPQYGVFDYIHFRVKNRTVTLLGYASRPTLKSSAEDAAKRVSGVESVQNEITVLPNSMNDDRIRAAIYRNVYSQPALQKYTSNRGGGRFGPSVARMAGGITNDPPLGWHAIHIIVENGNVTLRGVVDNSGDFAIAEMRANSTPGVFSVDNDLQVAAKEK